MPVFHSNIAFFMCILVSEDVNTLTIVVTWPEHILGLKHFHYKSQFSKRPDRTETYHSKLLRFEQFLKPFRFCNFGSVESTAKNVLPFQVQAHIPEKYSLVWIDNNSIIVYVKLRGHEKQFNTIQDNSFFEIC